MTTQTRKVQMPRTFEVVAWKWMRYSGVALVFLAWLHVMIKDVLVGVHAIDLQYVERIWSSLGWRLFDFVFLFAAWSHGMNGVRQVLMDYVHSPAGRRRTNWVLLVVWLVVAVMGAVAIIGGVRSQ